MKSKTKDRLIIAFICAIAIAFGFIVRVLPFYYLNTGKTELNNKNYVLAYNNLKRAYDLDSTNKDIRYYYVESLSHLVPTIAVQKELFRISEGKENDSAQNLAILKISDLRLRLTSLVSDNYIEQVTSENGIVRWDKSAFPLKICLKQEAQTPDYYKVEILRAINEWHSITGFLSFALVDEPEKANIYIKITKTPANICSAGKECKYVVGVTLPTIKKNILEKMTISIYNADAYGKYFSDKELYNTILHELGHALGIMGHSYNSNDIMYMSQSGEDDLYEPYKSSFQYLSTPDLNTITLLYNMLPDISNIPNDKIDTKGLIYPPILLGNSTNRNAKKIEEAENYIRKAPNLATGYIDLAGAYGESGNVTLALKTMDKASMLARNEDDLYLIKYNSAVICANNGIYDKAENFAKEAQKIKNDNDINELISNIQKQSKTKS